MNNEPVAWMSVELNGRTVLATYEFETAIPLYTHPVKELDEQFEKGFKAGKEEGWKAHKFHHPVKEQDESFDRTASHMAGEYVSYQKELTDEEILKVYEDMLGVASAKGSAIDFARAILRKAQEKC